MVDGFPKAKQLLLRRIPPSGATWSYNAHLAPISGEIGQAVE
jgi:hypothetical protein